MKLLLIFAFLTLAYMARSAPVSSSTARELILPDYHTDDETLSPDDSLEDLTTTTTRRSTYILSTRNRNTSPSRRPWTQRTSSIRTTTPELNDDQEEGLSKYIKQFGKYFKQLVEYVKQYFQNLSLHDIIKLVQRLFIKNDDD